MSCAGILDRAAAGTGGPWWRGRRAAPQLADCASDDRSPAAMASSWKASSWNVRQHNPAAVHYCRDSSAGAMTIAASGHGARAVAGPACPRRDGLPIAGRGGPAARPHAVEDMLTWFANTERSQALSDGRSPFRHYPAGTALAEQPGPGYIALGASSVRRACVVSATNTAMFLFRLFGGAGLEDRSRLVSGRAVQRRRLALLAIHSLQHPRAVRRDTLIAWLWPEHDTDRARHLLGDSLSLLRNGRGA
jgi:hypothetical protein